MVVPLCEYDCGTLRSHTVCSLFRKFCIHTVFLKYEYAYVSSNYCCIYSFCHTNYMHIPTSTINYSYLNLLPLYFLHNVCVPTYTYCNIFKSIRHIEKCINCAGRPLQTFFCKNVKRSLIKYSI